MFRVATIALNLDLELFFLFFFTLLPQLTEITVLSHVKKTLISRNSLATHVGTRMLYRPEAPRFMLPVQESTKNQKQLTTHTRKKSQ